MVEYIYIMTASKKIVVAVDISLSSGRAFLTGVLRYATTKRDWQICIIQSTHEFTAKAIRSMASDGTDGIVTTIMEGDLMCAALGAIPIPIVVAGTRTRDLGNRKAPVTYITVNEGDIGRCAAEYMLSLGSFASYGCVRSVDSLTRQLSLARANGFCRTIAERGHAAACVLHDEKERDALRHWLRYLPKPAAVFACRDATARDIIESCASEGISVPRQVSVLGANNDEATCFSCSPRLSSVTTGAEDEGFAAVRELDRLLADRRRKRAPKRTIICHCKNEIVVRRSTAHTKPATALIQNALGYIRSESHTRLTVRQVIEHVGVSRRLAEMRFRQILGKSIAEVIRETRLDRLAERILSEDSSLSAICRSCGFRHPAYAKTMFKRRFDMTMTAYRINRSSPRLIPVRGSVS